MLNICTWREGKRKRESRTGAGRGGGERWGREAERERNIYVLRHIFLTAYLQYMSATALDKLMHLHDLPDLY